MVQKVFILTGRGGFQFPPHLWAHTQAHSDSPSWSKDKSRRKLDFWVETPDCQNLSFPLHRHGLDPSRAGALRGLRFAGFPLEMSWPQKWAAWLTKAESWAKLWFLHFLYLKPQMLTGYHQTSGHFTALVSWTTYLLLPSALWLRLKPLIIRQQSTKLLKR